MRLGTNKPQKLPLHSQQAPAAGIGLPRLRVRLAQTILNLAECAEVDVANSIFVTAAISNIRLAALTGGRPKTVARMVEHLKLRGLIETRRDRIIIWNPAKLQDIVEKSLSREI